MRPNGLVLYLVLVLTFLSTENQNSFISTPHNTSLQINHFIRSSSGFTSVSCDETILCFYSMGSYFFARNKLLETLPAAIFCVSESGFPF